MDTAIFYLDSKTYENNILNNSIISYPMAFQL